MDCRFPWLSCVVVAAALLSACGSDAGPSPDESADAVVADSESDGGIVADVNEEDTTDEGDTERDTDPGRDAESDVTDALSEPDSRDGGPTDSGAPDSDDGGETSDGAADGDTGGDDVEDADAGDIRVFIPGTLPLNDFIACDENSDCPNGTGNCLRELTLNRTNADGRLRIPMAEVFPGLDRSGVCTLDCATSASVCSTLALPTDDTDWQCQLVWSGESAYPVDDSGARLPFPFDALIDPGVMAAGPAYGSVCRPPFERSRAYAPDFCVPCASTLNCHPGSLCVAESPWANPAIDAGFCVSPCSADNACPAGFDCRAADDSSDAILLGDGDGTWCFPSTGTCDACLDADGDEYGVGGCLDSGTASATDCDDLDPLSWWEGPLSTHSFPDVCGPDEDTNCNGLADDEEQVGTIAFGEFHCGGCDDPCIGGTPNASQSECVRLSTSLDGTCRAVCDEPTQFFDCDGILENGCETEVTNPDQLFIPDCDGDGFGRRGARPVFDCEGTGTLTIFTDVDGDDRTNDRRECAVVRAVLGADGVYGDDCNDAQPVDSPTGVEVCDGRDNDCDGETDPYTLFQLGDSCVPADPGIQGTCRDDGVRVCDDSGGVACEPGLPSDELCDGLDNDCDGSVDDFSVSSPENRIGESCRASEDGGRCGEGALTCQAGSLICEPVLLPAGDVPGDGDDADCDGVDADTERAIFVANGGATIQSPSAAPLGSPTNPVGTLARAWDLIRLREGSSTPIQQIILASGSYSLPHSILWEAGDPGMVLSGGWTWNTSARTWTRGASSQSTVEVSNTCPCVASTPSTGACSTVACPADAPWAAAIEVRDPVNILIDRALLEVATQPVGSRPTIGVACIASQPDSTTAPGCEGLTLRGVTIAVSAGSTGTSFATPGAAGEAGSPGLPGAESTAFPFWTPGPGGASTCGAQGGTGAAYVRRSNPACGTYNVPALATAGSPADVGGAPGASGGFSLTTCAGTGVATAGGRGRSRTLGTEGGTAGAGGSAPAPFRRISGTGGSSGLPGGGGGGSGSFAAFLVRVGVGVGGSSGGCGGFGGQNGGAGGTVAGLWIDDPQAGPVVEEVSIEVSNGGAGGNGQTGGVGGRGANLSLLDGSQPGGAGGHGSGGGGGGGGPGGWSIGVARWPTVAISVDLSVGSGGAAGRGGAGGAGGSGPIQIGPSSGDIAFETAVSGTAGSDGAPGSSAPFCSLAPGAPPSGEVACR